LTVDGQTLLHYECLSINNLNMHLKEDLPAVWKVLCLHIRSARPETESLISDSSWTL